MKKIQDFTVKEYRWLNSSSYVIVLQSFEPVPEIKAGNFAELKIPNAPDVFLRRPLSVLDADYKNNTLSFYVKVIGKGTKKLGELNNGETINVIYPLGNAFTVNGAQKVLIIGGGSGIAPFILLGRELRKKNIDATFLLGARTADEIVLTEEFGKYGHVLATTEDGSFGEKGLVIHHSVFQDIEDFDMIYTCGPEPMMKAVANIALQKNIACEASLENMMACGFGACLCCVTDTTSGNLCVCTDGPVFKTKDLRW
jgi:dihydroorotate dehydrogenase electron transfer subunit